MNAVRFPGPAAEPFDGPRVPPFSREAEQGVLGSVLISPKAWWEVADMLEEGDFYLRDHQLVWRGIAALVEAKKPIDIFVLHDWLTSHDMGEELNRGAYLAELQSTQASAFSVKAYAHIVRDRAQLRRMIDVGTQLVDAGFSSRGKSAVEIVGQAQSQIGSILDNEPCELEPINPIMSRVFSNLEKRFASDETIHGLRTGLDEFDELLGGLMPGLYILAARPKMGKTTLALNIAEHVALREKKAAAVFSFEMSREQLAERMLASVGGINGHHIRTGKLTQEDWSGVTHAMSELHGARLFLTEPKSARCSHLIAQLRRQHARTPLGLVVIDYLQLMEHDPQNMAQSLARTTRSLKLTSMELGVPILLLSQLNRDLEKRPNKRPVPSDTRDSGAIEQDCDAMVFVYRDEVYDPKSQDRGTAELIVALQRNGPAGTVRATYDAARFRFSNLPLDWMPWREPEPEGKPATSSGLKKGSRNAPAGNRGAGPDA